jgi:hypothetical protein
MAALAVQAAAAATEQAHLAAQQWAALAVQAVQLQAAQQWAALAVTAHQVAQPAVVQLMVVLQ